MTLRRGKHGWLLHVCPRLDTWSTILEAERLDAADENTADMAGRLVYAGQKWEARLGP